MHLVVQDKQADEWLMMLVINWATVTTCIATLWHLEYAQD